MSTKTNPPTAPKAEAKATTQPFLKIGALQEGGRHRAGRFWPQDTTEVPASDFDKKQLELLKGDKLLLVVEFDKPVEAEGAAADEAQS